MNNLSQQIILNSSQHNNTNEQVQKSCEVANANEGAAHIV